MPRAIWSGSISFGLVNIPVKLYNAVSRKNVSFNQIDIKTGSRVKMQRVSAADGREVPYEDIVKGYELTPDRYVLIEPGELEALDPKKTKSIEIEDFVALDDIDPIYYDHPYYLAPGPGGAKPYRLLLEAMQQTGRVAIATVVIRSKQQLVAVRPIGDHALGMATMVFPDEVIDADTIDEIEAVEDIEINDRELAIAEQLVESLAADFDPDKYRDTYREDVLALVERKAAGEHIAVQPDAEEEEAEVPDLMSALKASLDAVKKRDGNGGSSSKDSAKKKSSSGSSSKAKKETAKR